MDRSSRAPWWRPDRFGRALPRLRRRAAMVRAVRAFFDQRDFLEVETPALQVSPGLEPHLMSFATALEGPDGRVRRRMHLHTSPEFAMKKLLVGGAPRIFQLARVFRNREGSRLHSPEFTLLEWYRAGASYRDLMADCRCLLQAALRATGEPAYRMGEATADPFSEWLEISVAEAFERWAGIDLLATMPDPAAPSAALLADAAAAAGIAPRPDDDWETLFFRIFLERIEPHLGVGAPAILYDYPISMAALSRPKAGDPRLAERFELYVCGVELANAFGELTDAAVQHARFVADMDRKEQLYGMRYPIDLDFIAALEQGMPESAGIALGIDRLAMLATGAGHIDEVLWAPVDAGRGGGAVTGGSAPDTHWRLVPDAAHPHGLALGRCRHGTFLYSRHDTIGRFLDQYGEWAEPEAALLASLLRPGDIAIDVGAHMGSLTVPLARAVGPDGTVLAFEPQRFLFHLLCANVALNGLSQVQCFEHALGERAERAWVKPINYASPGNFGLMSLGGAYEAKEGEGVAIRVWPLDQRAPGVARCRLIKIDVEGLEDAVLAGAEKFIERTRPFIYFEMNRLAQDAVLVRLKGWRYRMHWHPVPLFYPGNFAGSADNTHGTRGDLNVLAVPEEMPDQFPALAPATDWAGAVNLYSDLLFAPKASRR